jgi:hypothetical protein
MTEKYGIGTVAELVASVRYIKEGVDSIAKSAADMDSRLRTLEKSVAVLETAAKDHKEAHADLDDRVTRNGRLNGIATAMMGALATFIGVKYG